MICKYQIYCSPLNECLYYILNMELWFMVFCSLFYSYLSCINNCLQNRVISCYSAAQCQYSGSSHNEIGFISAPINWVSICLY